MRLCKLPHSIAVFFQLEPRVGGWRGDSAVPHFRHRDDHPASAPQGEEPDPRFEFRCPAFVLSLAIDRALLFYLGAVAVWRSSRFSRFQMLDCVGYQNFPSPLQLLDWHLGR
ncbi:hypothetical protein DAI22_11g024300 [Oryza sativa Japonica Group]|nr:hypothetical protein DAI22_11g024300 [Oryza sativa Japonica Group]